jgi:putative membrane protein
LVPAVFELGDWPAEFAYPAQIGVFLALGVLVQWAPIKLRLVPSSVKRRRAARLAREQFITQGLHSTANRAGVLLFVAVGERYVEILADHGIAANVDNAAWQRIVDAFIADVRAGRIGEGFVKAVNACGTVMARHFPPEPEKTSQLPNNLIEISP